MSAADRVSVQVDKAHYAPTEYDTLGRFKSYWQQLTLVLNVGPESCLEVGVGNGTMRALLAHHGVVVTTVDFDASLAPDRQGDVRRLPCHDDEFDVVLCAEVLEHLPFDDVPLAISELRRVCRRSAVLSVPQFGRQMYFGFRVPPLRLRQMGFPIPSRHRFTFNGEHYWEVGARNASRRAFRAILQKHFVIEREFSSPEYAYHRFYLLRVL